MVDSKRSRFESDDMTRLQAMRAAEYPGGVVVDPVPITTGEEVTVLYHGLLSESGADRVWMRVGSGEDDRWDGVQDQPMERTAYGWAKNIRVETPGRLHLCFKDSASNWDNNSGLNWSFTVHGGPLPQRQG